VAEVAAYCTSHGIEHRWIDETLLRTEQRSQGVALHPSTGERVFFNQAHLFHVSSLEPEAEQALIEAYGRDRLPRHARFGDGGELPRSDLDQVRAAFRAHRIAFPWQRGDVLLLDNMQAAHGRRPFTGKRQVVAALMDQVTPRTYESLRNAS
jgi:alpha-ketoglutarate-dependent taurine dioxygenase